LPFSNRKLRRCGICSRSDGNVGIVASPREFGIEKQLATDVLEAVMMDFKRKALFYDANGDEANYRYYSQATIQAAKELARYQSPKLSAVAVGRTEKSSWW
jgi:hypothetical protein